MCYEEAEPYVVNDEGGEYIAQTPTEESARKHLIEYFTHQDSRLDHIGTGNNATIDLTIAVAEFDLEHPDLYKFQPTAEWSRIQQALKEREWMKECLVCLQLFMDFERDATEVANEYYNDWSDMVDEKKAELSSLKSRLPVNADGDNVFIGDEVWVWSGGKQKKCDVIGVRVAIDGFKLNVREECEFGMRTPWLRNKHCHSTAESCRAANEGEEGENDADR